MEGSEYLEFVADFSQGVDKGGIVHVGLDFAS